MQDYDTMLVFGDYSSPLHSSVANSVGLCGLSKSGILWWWIGFLRGLRKDSQVIPVPCAEYSCSKIHDESETSAT